jgi:hypothetical protein
MNEQSLTKKWKMDLSQISDARLMELSKKRILFGHKSVGKNIINGIRKLQKVDPKFTLINLVEYHAGDDTHAPGLYYTNNGHNGLPKSKCDNFYSIINNNNLGSKIDIAFFKFCYVDIQKKTEVDALFEYYYNKMIHLEEKFPELILVHITCPLRAHAFGLKGKIKSIFIPDMANIKRNQYNNLLRSGSFKDMKIFDLAKIESTLPDNSRETFGYNDREYYALAKMYTDDGGHLNELGQRITAFNLLKELVNISSKINIKILQ